MAKLSSKNSIIMVEVASVPTAIVSATDWTLNCNRNTIDVSTLATEWKEFLVGQIAADGSCNLIYDPDDSDADQAVEDAMFGGVQITFHIRPEGTGTGMAEWTLPAFVTGYNASAATEDAIRIAVTFTGAGPMTRGTQTATP